MDENNNENNNVINNNDLMNVLVIVDVQNCFMFHPDKVTDDTTGLNAGQEASEYIVKELETLVADKTHVRIFERFSPGESYFFSGI